MEKMGAASVADLVQLVLFDGLKLPDSDQV